jgi:hypothetical protein
MNLDVLIPVISFIFCSGVIYGSLNNRMKQIESQIQDGKDIAQRLAKIEVQMEIIIKKINNEKN